MRPIEQFEMETSNFFQNFGVHRSEVSYAMPGVWKNHQISKWIHALLPASTVAEKGACRRNCAVWDFP
jgi:hypothetical protein